MRGTFFFFIMIVITLGACNHKGHKKEQQIGQSPDHHNSQNALTWQGTYRGTLPCADCSGIQRIIRLKQDSTYNQTSIYLGEKNGVFHQEGTLKWNEAGNKITLTNEAGTKKQYRVEENKLRQLDLHGHKITGSLAKHYVLSKTNQTVIGKKWKLITLQGKTVNVQNNRQKVPYFSLSEDSARVHGNGGCNHFFGQYILSTNHKLSFAKIASTKMACSGVDYEHSYFSSLKATDRYVLHGDTLKLKNQNGEVIAKFLASNRNNRP